MKHLLLFLLCIPAALSAQPFANFGFYEPLREIVCIGDSTTTVMAMPHWSVYQTLNNQWDGPVDSSRCISMIQTSRDVRIPLDEIDPSKKVFLRYDFTDSTKVRLQKNWVYLLSSFFRTSEDNLLKRASGAGQEGSSIHFGVEIPDRNGEGSTFREYSAHLQGSGSFYFYDFCLSTEKFDTQFLKKLYVAFQPLDTTYTASHQLRLNYNFLEPSTDTRTIDEVTIPEEYYYTYDSSYYLHVYDIYGTQEFYYGDILFAHGGTGYPGTDNLWEIRFTPEQNQPDPQRITLDWSYVALHQQPFTALRGGFVEGSDSLRHQLTVISEESVYCLGFPWVDVIVHPEVSLFYKSGDINFAGPNACLQFKNGGRLIVDEGAQLTLGNEGDGMLVLNTNSTFELRPQSSLTIDCRLFISESDPRYEAAGQVYVDLHPGTRLSFGPGARLSNQYSIDGTIRLNVRMLGGELDDSLLPAADRRLINRIYPESTAAKTGLSALQLLENPVKEVLLWEWHGDEAERVSWALYNAFGQAVRTGVQPVFAGAARTRTRVADLPAGMYYLAVESVVQPLLIR